MNKIKIFFGNIYWVIYSFLCTSYTRKKGITKLIKEVQSLKEELKEEKALISKLLEERNQILEYYSELKIQNKELKEEFLSISERYYDFVRKLNSF